QILQDGPHRRFLGVVVDHEVHALERLLEERGLGVDHRERVVLLERARLDLLDVDLEDARHGAVLGTRAGAEGRDRRRRLVAATMRAWRARSTARSTGSWPVRKARR